MFGSFLTSPSKDATAEKHHQSSAQDEESQSFLSKKIKLNSTELPILRRLAADATTPWKASSAILALLLSVSVFFNARSMGETYASGFSTELSPALPAIKVHPQRFYGGIIVNSSSQFELILNPDSPRYTGRPTQELDDAWDKIVGNYVALTDAEARAIPGIALEDGKHYVVPHVRHSLHCVNYLRKVAYDKYYPTLRTENKPTVPTFEMHVDHCIETLRETIQCGGDLTPVPHVWSTEKQMFLADTSLDHTCRDYEAIMKWQDERDEAWRTGKLHN